MPDDRSFHLIEAVADRLEGAPRTPRRRWSDAFKARLVAETLAPEANVSAIARRAGIAPSQLFGWRRQAIKNGSVTPVVCDDESTRFVEGDTSESSVVEINIEGIVVRVGADIAENHLRRIIRAVRSAA